MRSTLTVREIAERLGVGRLAVYRMLEQGLLPGIRVGKRWIVTRAALEQWERTCGFMGSGNQTSNARQLAESNSCPSA